MNIIISDSPSTLGKRAADCCAKIIKEAIAQRGVARVALSTGASQFDTIDALVKSQIDWRKVEVFHLDEYIGLPDAHPASFRKYIRERFLEKVNVKQAFLVDGEGMPDDVIAKLNAELRSRQIDLGLIGIGENAHVAFNDPPADFEIEDAYIIVNLNHTCKEQQVREGWFPSVNEVPAQAISMSVHQIMQCRHIISCVPHAVKAKAIQNVLAHRLTPDIPATMLKKHPEWTLLLDRDSAALLDERHLRDMIIATQ